MPVPKPARTPVSTKVFTGGMIVLFGALILSLAGVPGSIGYHGDAAGKRNKPTSSNPLAVQNSMDSNLRWMAEHSNDEPGHYVGEIKSINQSETAIPAMVEGLTAMNASVLTIDSKLREVLATTNGVSKDMGGMLGTSQHSAATMASLGSDVDQLGAAMAQLGAATQVLTESMAGIQMSAEAIAAKGTSAALKSAADMNGALPDHVPSPPIDGQPNVGNPVIAGAAQ
jgi:uncharacterized protein YoxC